MRYKAATVAQLELLVHKLQDLYCVRKEADQELELELEHRELCRQCDVKALALMAAFHHPRYVEDVGPGAHIPTGEEFEELPF